MSLKYGLTCETCGHVSRWLSAAPTLCPVNPTHTINPDSISIEETARVNTSGATIIKCDNRDYHPIYSYVTQGTLFFLACKSLPIYVKLVSSVESGSYQFRFRDVFSGAIYYESPVLTNMTPQFNTITISDIVDPPLGETCIDVEFKSSESVVTVRCAMTYVTQF